MADACDLEQLLETGMWRTPATLNNCWKRGWAGSGADACVGELIRMRPLRLQLLCLTECVNKFGSETADRCLPRPSESVFLSYL